MSDKKIARMARNRVSAQESRERKRQYTQDLEGRVKSLEQERDKYRTAANGLQQRVEELTEEIRQLKRPRTEPAEPAA